MPGNVSLAEAGLIALFLETLLFGVFAVLYAITTWTLLFRKKRKQSISNNVKALSATSTVMFILALAHLSVSMYRAVQGFIRSADVLGGATIFYSKFNAPTFVVNKILYVTQTLIADSFMVYRLSVIFRDRLWIVAMSATLTLSTAVMGYIACYEASRTLPDKLFEANNIPWITAFFSCSLATNVIATLLIAAPVLWLNFRMRGLDVYGGIASSWTLLETFVQSAALYSGALILLLVLFFVNNNAQLACVDAMQPLIGIVFTLIIIRVGLSDLTGTNTTTGAGTISTRVTTNPTGSGSTQLKTFWKPRRAVQPLDLSMGASTQQDDRTSFEDYPSLSSKGRVISIEHAEGGVRPDPEAQSGVV